MKSESLLFKMALARLRVRKLRLFLTVLTSSILFAVFIFVTGTSSGLINQYRLQSDKVFDGKYYALAIKPLNQGELRQDPAVIELARKLYNGDPSHGKDGSNGDPVQYQYIGGTKTAELVYGNKYTDEAIDQTVSVKDQARLQNAGALSLPAQTLVANDGSLEVLRNGTDPRLNGTKSASLFTSVTPGIVKRQMIQRYVGYSGEVNESEVPILLTEQLGRDVLQEKNTNQSIVGRTFAVCYRDNVSTQTITSLRFASPDEKMQSSYELPKSDEGCQPLVLRPNVPKQISLKTRSVTFRIVGILPAAVSDKQETALGYFGIYPLLLGSDAPQALVPLEDYVKEQFKDIFLTTTKTGPYAMFGGQIRYLQFDNATQLTSYIAEHGCTSEEELNNCPSLARPFVIKEFVTVQQRTLQFEQTLRSLALPVISILLVISTIILGSNFMRIVDDARREIAIYYAIGASGRQVFRLFIYYGLAVATLIVLSSLFIGVVAMAIVSSIVSAQLSQIISSRLFANHVLSGLSIVCVDVYSTMILAGLVYATVVVILSCVILLRQGSIRKNLSSE